MLSHLTIRDFALIRALDLSFEAGLTVLTGESGAGKTILLDALGLVLGDRANAANVRPGAARSEVVAAFDLAGNEHAKAWLAAQGLTDEAEPNACLLRRVVGADGRSRAFVNGTPVNATALAALAASLIDIHAQHEHQQLLRRAVQLELLDHYAGTLGAQRDVADAFRRWHDAAQRAAELETRIAAAHDRRDLLRYQVGELDALDLRAGEFEALDAQFRRLAKAEEIARTLGHADAALSGERESGIADLARLSRLLDGIDDRHAALDAARDLLRTALSHLDEVAAELRRYADAIDSAPEELKRIDARLSQLHELARKHRLKPDALAAHLATLQQELARLDVGDQDLAALAAEAATQKERFVSLAQALSKKRRKAAKGFEAAVSKHMRELGIKGGALALEFTDVENESGIDAVDYFVTTNPKFPAGALAQIASGGERSRISLAIQVVAAQKARLPALILDEADVGIGGATADVVGRLLQKLAQYAQVLCVTHAPQVAARGTHHLRVGKSKDGETFVETLAGETRVAELARMLAGREITAKTLDLAEELINAGNS